VSRIVDELDDPLPIEKSRRPRLRWLKRIGTGLLVVALVLGGWLAWHHYQATKRLQTTDVRANTENGETSDQDLRQALSEADRLDPDWRLEQLEAKRPVLATDKNSAEVVRAVRKLLPEKLLPLELAEITKITPPKVRLSAVHSELLRRELDKVKPALVEASRLAELPSGRHTIQWAADLISTPLTHLIDSSQCADMLRWQAWRQTEDGDLDGALTSCRGSMNAGRSIGDEPLSLSQISRLAVQSHTARTVERVLAQGEASEQALRSMQELLQDEEQHPTLLIIMRYERIWQHTYFTGLANGTMKWSDYSGKYDEAAKQLSPEEKAATDARMAKVARANHARALRLANEAVEIAKRPSHEHKRLFEELKASLPKTASELLEVPTILYPGPAWSHAKLQCTVVGLAVERYRQKHGHWPASLEEELGLPKKMLADPFDGQPLRYRRLPDGVAIWSVGLDGKDDEGRLSNFGAWDSEGKDVGFRLWDVKERRPKHPSPG
jgi:hypothetical protein